MEHWAALKRLARAAPIPVDLCCGRAVKVWDYLGSVTNVHDSYRIVSVVNLPCKTRNNLPMKDLYRPETYNIHCVEHRATSSALREQLLSPPTSLCCWQGYIGVGLSGQRNQSNDSYAGLCHLLVDYNARYIQ